MLTRTITIVVLSALILIRTDMAGQSQARRLDTDAAEVARSLRTSGDPGLALQVLTQQYGSVSPSKLNAIADSLVEIAMHFPGDSIKHVLTRQAALITLVDASRGSRGVAYAGGPERLLRLVQEGRSGGALWGITQIPNKVQALQMIRGLATSQNPMAHEAVRALANDLGAAGLEALRDLYRGNAITQREARQLASIIAANLKWK
jgi:hypothetical protein